MEFVVLIVVIMILIIGIPIGLSIIIYKFIKKRNFNKKFQLIALIPVLTIVYLICTAVYPLDEFYIEKYEEVTNMKFPDKGIIKYKSASYPDQFGDYTACFVVELEQVELELLKNNLEKNGFVKKSFWIGSEEMEYINEKTKTKKFVEEYYKAVEDKNYNIGFLNDNKSIIIQRSSS